MMPQQIILQPLGLITQPNKLGTMPIGALSQADRALMRDPGTIEIAPAWETKSVTRTAVMGYVIPIGTSLIWFTTTSGLATSQYGWYAQSNGAQTFAPTNLIGEDVATYLVDYQGTFGYVIARGRAFLQCRTGHLVFDYADPQTSAEKTPRVSGLPPTTIRQSAALTNPGTGTPGGLPPQTGAHYVAVLRRVFADGYEVVSSPGAAFHAYNGAAALSSYGRIRVSINDTYMRVGDQLELYRTASQPIDITAPSDNNTNTGSDFYRVASRTLSAADIAGTTYEFRDNVPNLSMGEPLYTNQGLKGASALALPPPTSKAMASFKGHAFYANTTSAPNFKFRIPVFFGDMFSVNVPAVAADAAAESVRRGGIGTRRVTGTASSGSATLTAVPASDIVGIVVGQLFDNSLATPRWASTGYSVTAVTASTITFSTAANSSGAAEIEIADIMEINGTRLNAGDTSTLFTAFADYSNSFPSLGLFPLALDRVYPDGGPSSYRDTVPADYITITRAFANPASLTTPILVRATNGANYEPELPAIELAETARSLAAEVQPNRVVWSELNQPENVPLANFTFIGRGVIYQMYSTRDANWIFASDGLWRLSGTGGSVGPEGYDWRVDPVDSSLILAGPQAGCVYRDTVYALTTRGFVSVTSDGSVSQISSGRIDDIMPPVADWSLPTQYTQANAITVEADPFHNEIWIRFPPTGTDAGRLFVYSVFADAFTNDIVANLNGDTGLGVQWFFYLPSARSIYATYALNSAQQWIVAPTLGPTLGMELKYQPLVAEEPFGMHHWQVLDVSVQLVGPSGSTGRAYANNNVSLDTATRSFVGNDESEYARLGWGIPRNVPAVANAFAPRLSMGGSATVGHRIKLQGVAVTFEAMTIQRKKR